MDKTVTQLAKEKTATDKAYGEAFRAHLRTFKPLDIDQFWGVIAQLRKNLQSDRGVKSAIHNLFCAFVYRSYGEADVEGWPTEQLPAWEAMARFLARYEQVSGMLSKKSYEMKGLDRGDDGYGDLMDSLPLAGEQVFNRIMGDDIANGKQLDKAFDSTCPVGEPTSDPLKNFILHGENYITMTFEKVLMKAFVSVSCEYEEEPRSREDAHVVLCTEAATLNSNKYVPVGLRLTVKGPFHDKEEADAFVKQEGGTAVKIWGATILR